MIKYNFKLDDKFIHVKKNDNHFGRVNLPQFSSVLYKNIFIKTFFAFALTTFDSTAKVIVPNNMDIKKRDIAYATKVFETIGLEFPSDIELETSALFDEPELKHLGNIEKDESKHVLFFSGGKESWYNLLELVKNTSQENILFVYINKMNKTSRREMIAVEEAKTVFPKINYAIVNVTPTLPKKYAYPLEYMLMLSAVLDKILLFNGGANITFGFQDWSFLKKDTYLDSFSETIEAEKFYLDYLSDSFGINLNPFNRLSIKEDKLYNYGFFKEAGVVEKVVSCIVPDGLATMHRNRFRKDCVGVGTLVTDTMCGYCSKCSLRLFYEILQQDDSFFIEQRDDIKLWMSSFINREIAPLLPKKSDPVQFFNYDIYFISFCLDKISEISIKLKEVL